MRLVQPTLAVAPRPCRLRRRTSRRRPPAASRPRCPPVPASLVRRCPVSRVARQGWRMEKEAGAMSPSKIFVNNI